MWLRRVAILLAALVALAVLAVNALVYRNKHGANPSLSAELNAMATVDQAIRNEALSLEEGTPESDAAWQRMAAIDAKNTARMKQIIARYGWPGRRLVGAQAAHHAWLLVQHADAEPDFQAKCLELVKEAAQRGDASALDVAYLEDRVLLKQGKKQRYGTQFTCGGADLAPLPLEDPEHVDERRASVGLPSLEAYRQQMLRASAPAPADGGAGEAPR